MKKISVFLVILYMSLSGCSSYYNYNVTFKNISDEKIWVEHGVWGEWAVQGGYISGFSEEAIFPSGRTHGDWRVPIPDSIGAVWRNAEDEMVEDNVIIDKSKIPRIGRNKDLQFVIALTQSDIHQVEVVVHDLSNLRQKKEKAMLFCSEGENGCEYLTPFTTDTYYDPEKLTPAQKEKLRREREAGEKFREGLEKDLKERGLR